MIEPCQKVDAKKMKTENNKTMDFIPEMSIVCKKQKERIKNLIPWQENYMYDVNMIEPTHFKMIQGVNYRTLFGSMF